MPLEKSTLFLQAIWTPTTFSATLPPIGTNRRLTHRSIHLPTYKHDGYLIRWECQ